MKQFDDNYQVLQKKPHPLPEPKKRVPQPQEAITSAVASAATTSVVGIPKEQWLIHFENKTYVCNIPQTRSTTTTTSTTTSCSHHMEEEAQQQQQQQQQKHQTIFFLYIKQWLSEKLLLSHHPPTLQSFSQLQTKLISLLDIVNVSYPSTNTTTSTTTPSTTTATHNYITLRLKSFVLGGKGGFGTLLKGQSRQAGAKITTDFGACRDLQGRRLRHVNDEIKLRLWKQQQEKKKSRGKNNKQDDDDSVFFNTPSGLYNWHLLTPNWANISKKGTNKIKRQYINEQKQQQKKQKLQEHRENLYYHSIQNYVDATNQTTQKITNTIFDSIQEGIQLKKEQQQKEKILLEEEKKKKDVDNDNNYNNNHDKEEDIVTVQQFASQPNEEEQEENLQTTTTTQEEDEEERPSSLCTLSGEVVVVYVDKEEESLKPATKKEKEKTTTKKNNPPTMIQIQSKSNFATVGLLLNRNYNFERTEEDNKEDDIIVLYYELKLITGGCAQVGWAHYPTSRSSEEEETSTTQYNFQPNDDTGDGVGDDPSSYGYDGSRNLFFHNGNEIPYPSQQQEEEEEEEETTTKKKKTTKHKPTFWKANDVIGCLYNITKQELSYSWNGKHLGTALTIPSTTSKNPSLLLYPAFSCNKNEILELRIYEKDMDFFPHNVTNKKEDDNNTHVLPMEKILITSSSAMDKGKDNKPEKETAAASTTTITENKVTTTTDEAVAATTSRINLEDYNSSKELEAFGLEHLKNELHYLGVKCGGTLQERASRLYSLKGLAKKEYPQKVRGKNFLAQYDK